MYGLLTHEHSSCSTVETKGRAGWGSREVGPHVIVKKNSGDVVWGDQDQWG